MKDAYSFHLTDEGLVAEYDNMHAAYTRIFTRLGLDFRAVLADSGAIGGDASQEFHVLADSGEDAIAFSTGSDYAANLETAQAASPAARARRRRSAAQGRDAHAEDLRGRRRAAGHRRCTHRQVDRGDDRGRLRAGAGARRPRRQRDQAGQGGRPGRLPHGHRSGDPRTPRQRARLPRPGRRRRSRSASSPTAKSPRWPISWSAPTKPVSISPA